MIYKKQQVRFMLPPYQYHLVDEEGLFQFGHSAKIPQSASAQNDVL